MKFKNVIKTVLITWVLFAVITEHSKAQDRFTLDEAIKAALEHNYDIRIQLMDAEKAGNLATRGNAGLFPSVGITGELKQSYGSVNLVPGSFFRDLSGQQGDHAPPDIHYDGVSSTALNAGLGAEMVIYSGRSGQIRYRLLQAGQAATFLQFQERVEKTMLELTGAYIQTALLQESLKLQNEVLKQSRDRYLRLKGQRRYGQASEQQLLQTHADLKSDSTAFRDLEHQLENAWRDLHHKIGWDRRTKANLEPELRVDSRFELPDLMQQAHKENRMLQLAELQADMSAGEIDLARSSGLPMLTASARYGYNYLHASEGQFETQEQLGATGGLALRIPLFQGGQASTAVQNARIERRQHEVKRKQTRDGMEAEIENQWTRFSYLVNQLETEKSNLPVYDRNYEHAIQSHRQGLITGLELRNAQLSLLEARLQVTRLALELKLTESELLYLSGELLSYFTG